MDVVLQALPALRHGSGNQAPMDAVAPRRPGPAASDVADTAVAVGREAPAAASDVPVAAVPARSAAWFAVARLAELPVSAAVSQAALPAQCESEEE